VFSRGEESRDVQVDGVGLGFARGAEKTPIVTKVPPELARSLEISLALVWIPHHRLCALNVHEVLSIIPAMIVLSYVALKTKHS